LIGAVFPGGVSRSVRYSVNSSDSAFAICCATAGSGSFTVSTMMTVPVGTSALILLPSWLGVRLRLSREMTRCMSSRLVARAAYDCTRWVAYALAWKASMLLPLVSVEMNTRALDSYSGVSEYVSAAAPRSASRKKTTMVSQRRCAMRNSSLKSTLNSLARGDHSTTRSVDGAGWLTGGVPNVATS
jgi:hypothetical protein